MPAMPRFSKQGTKIAYKLLGVPANIAFKPTKKEKEIDKRLVFERTSLER